MNNIKRRRITLSLIGMSTAIMGTLAARHQEAFSEKDFDTLLGGTKYAVVMFYNAGWTGDLVAKLESAEAAFHRVSKIDFYEKTGVEFFAVDTSRDNLARVAKSYGVQEKEPTFMLFKNGIPMADANRKEAQLVGFVSAADIEAFIDEYFYDELLELYNQKRAVRPTVVVQPETRVIQRVRYVDQPSYYYDDDYYYGGYYGPRGWGYGLGGLGIGLGVGYGVGRYNRGGFYGGGGRGFHGGGGRGGRGGRGGGGGRGGRGGGGRGGSRRRRKEEHE